LSFVSLKIFFALPGERLYLVKKTILDLKESFFKKDNTSERILVIVDQKLKELEIASFENKVKQLPEVFKECQSVSQKTAKAIKENKEEKLVLEKELLRDIVARQQNVRASLNSSEVELKDFNCAVFEKLSEDLEQRSLNSFQREIFEQAKRDYQENRCLDALTKVLYLDNNQ
jgi:hypothetical protein